MPTSYSVRFWKTEVYKGRKRSTYYVRWVVGGESQRKPFVEKTLADSFRSELVTAARKGEAFDIESGLPMTMMRAGRELPWYALACEWADLKWPRAAATTRQTHAYALTQLTAALLIGPDRGRPDAKVLRKALTRWAFTPRREAPDAPAEIRVALRWVAGHTAAVSALADPLVLRPLLDALTVRLDGRPAAASVVSRRRKILVAVIGHAVERQLLAENPLPALRWTAPKSSQAIDRRRVPNPVQARTLLAAVRRQARSGARLVAFFGCLYFAGLRPEEAVALATANLAIPAKGWGRLHVEWAEPHVGREWTDNGQNRDRRQLKQRAVGEVRVAPCPPELTALLNWHVAEFGTGPDGRIFTGERNSGELPKATINRAWQRARAEAFTPEAAASSLAEVPYDLRHACLSTWLNSGVPPAQVAEWAGHSVEILHRIYAKCIDGGEELWRRRIDDALGYGG